MLFYELISLCVHACRSTSVYRRAAWALCSAQLTSPPSDWSSSTTAGTRTRWRWKSHADHIKLAFPVSSREFLAGRSMGLVSVEYAVNWFLHASVCQLPDKYVATVLSVLFQTHLVKEASLFPELLPLVAAASPADIEALPSVQDNVNV